MSLLTYGTDLAQPAPNSLAERRQDLARILIIDDNEIVRETVRRVVKASGHSVETAPDGTAGLAKFAGEAFDLVICDLHMPGEGGAATIQAIRNRNPDIGIIAMSGSGTSDALASATGLGANLTLAKPFQNKELLAAISTATAPPPR